MVDFVAWDPDFGGHVSVLLKTPCSVDAIDAKSSSRLHALCHTERGKYHGNQRLIHDWRKGPLLEKVDS
jgi:hypothetical protein